MNYLILGGSAGLGRALAEQSAAQGHNLILLATDARDLRAIASDLAIRHHVEVETVAADLSSDSSYLDDLWDAAGSLGGLDGIFCPIGVVHPGDSFQHTASVAQYLFSVNYFSVVSVVTRFWDMLSRRPHRAVIVGFGSVAAFRGRNANVAYAAAKRALSSFFESLRHAALPTRVLVQFYILGYLDTNLAFGKRTLLPRAKPEILARRVCRNIDTDFGVAYHPNYWRCIHPVLANLPWLLFKHLKF